MDLTWNLDTLYTSFNSDKFKADIKLRNCLNLVKKDIEEFISRV